MNSGSESGKKEAAPTSTGSPLEPSSAGADLSSEDASLAVSRTPIGANGSSAAPASQAIAASEAAIAQNGNQPTPPSEDPDFSAIATAEKPPATGQSPPAALVMLGSLLLIGLGISFNLTWLTLIGALLSLALSWGLISPLVQELFAELSPRQRSLLIAFPAFIIGLYGLMRATGITQAIRTWGVSLRWDILGALGDFLGGFGQIFVALLALYVAWRQYVISRDLTLQQNRITQQQTIDSYFQGISELVLDDEGLLEDWPQERIIAEARTSAILSSIDAPGKAKIIRFLSRSKLLTPLQRDRHLGRPILDGKGGYAEDRAAGVRVINLGAMLANADLSGTDLRWTDLSDVNLIRADLSHCDLVRANFSRTILYCANLAETDLMGARFFYGTAATSSPRSRTDLPNLTTGEHTGAVVEGTDFSGAKRMSEEQRQYCCRWGGEKIRATIPGGCEGIPNCLGR